ncbi:MAG: S-layer homology domain-containing protein [Paenibacillus lautus]|jgi:protocatechuate 3,4-dioxygenase beta subunit|uniref:S-layer homology domain-containing protein n=1 Tax=Paenibacillus lautus TaxID=1401 RepID=UPI0026F16B3A|nr:S-layer homology domain-containing protein [Paenibacillus lautus]MCI1773674.1 S-layer homology domain-containing protein [Paenibacillus lautus]
MKKSGKFGSLFMVICMLVATFQPLTTPAYAAATEDKWVTYKLDDFSNAKQVGLFSLNGQAKVTQDSKGRDILRLTEAQGNQFGTAFNKKLIAAGNNYSFSTFFKFRLNGDNRTNSPADGITFTIQAQSNSAGEVGVGIGYGGIKPSFAVKYDTYQNASPVNDPSANYIGLAKNGSVNNINPDWYTTNLNGITLSGGEDLYSWIDYDGQTKVVKVYLSKVAARPTTPVLETSNIDLDEIFTGYPGVYAGFTSATGGSMETHDILEWYFTNEIDPIDKENPGYVYKQAPTQVKIQAIPTGQPGQYQLVGTALDYNGDPVEGAPLTFSSEKGTPVVADHTANHQGQATTILDFGTETPSGTVTVVTVGGAYATVQIPDAPSLNRGTTPDQANTLTWNTVTGATYYNLYKDGVLLDSNITTPSYLVSGVTPDQPGQFTVTAVIVTDEGIIESIPSNSVQLPVDLGLTLDKDVYDLKPGMTHQTVVSSVYSDGTKHDVTLDPGTVITVKDPKVAIIDENGLLTAVGAGSTVIDAVYNGKPVQSVIKVSIDAPALKTGQVNATNAELLWNAVPGAQTYNIYDANGQLIADGVTGTSYVLSGLKPETKQSYVIKAVSNGIESPASPPVEITTPASGLRDLLIDPASVTLQPGDQHTPKVTAVSLDESIQDVTGKATYTSSDDKVATVDANGVVTAVAPGTAIITATHDGKSVTQTVHVHDQALSYNLDVTVTPEGVLADGKSPVTVTAKATDSNGNPVPGVPVVITYDSGKTKTVTTNEEGIAVWTYEPSVLTDTTPLYDIVVAEIQDPGTGTIVQASKGVHYFPAAIDGIVVDQMTGKPVAGAKITVESDFNNDGIPDFSAEVTTGEDGSYKIPVPRGNYTYELNIETPVQIGGREVTLTQSKEVTIGTVQPGQTIKPSNLLRGQLFVASASGASNPDTIGDILGSGKAVALLQGLNGSSFKQPLTVANDGTFSLDQVPPGKYQISYQLELADGTVLAGPASILDVDMTQDGQTAIVYSLIDPYGTITDASTGKVISGADVQLYWADTELNRQKGRVPNTLVSLPALAGFAPNQNANPQISDAAGEYAWMVYPEGDYYIVAKRSGYYTYDTRVSKPNAPAVNGSDSYIKDGIIHVGQSIIAFDFAMQPVPSSGNGGDSSGSGSSPSPQPQGDVTLNLSTDKKQVQEGTQSTITVDYANRTHAALRDASVQVTLPEGAEVVNAHGGKVDGRTVTWNVAHLPAGSTGNFKLDIKWGLIAAKEIQYEIIGQLTAGSSKKSNSVHVQVFSDRFGDLQHQRYILGFPDGKFHPSNTLTRAELAAIVARLSEKTTGNANSGFNDIRKGHWATDYIRIAVSQGYFNGYADHTFRPDAPVTRGELAAVLARFLDLDTSASVNRHFTDIEGSWAAESIEALYRNNLLSGYPGNTFRPNNRITRVEAVTLINKALYRGPLTGLEPLFPDVAETHWGFGDVQEATVSHQSTRNSDGVEVWVSTLKDNVK